ncbi:LuxR C-terminal-related transcriptional regulator [Streptomyces sp. NPDC050509]|uniref:LuxR C-terminal-related transcriptional regulator n=1 Tax=Streptomyces sp. NPDC050509 TaxID=3365620 RepID=UPI0037B96A7D
MTQPDAVTHREPSPAVSAGAHTLLRRLVRGEQVGRAEPGCTELIALGLAVHDPHSDRWGVADLHHAEQTAMAEERAGIARHLQRMHQLDELYRDIRTHESPTGNGIEFLDRVEHVNAAIMQAADYAQSHMYTAHPVNRTAKGLAAVVPREIKLLQRGIARRTIYSEPARTRAAEQEWATTMSAHGAEIRTLASDFERMILVDRRFAIISDHRDEPNRMTAFKVTHPGMVAFLHHLFDQQWERAEPWMGGRFLPREGIVTTGRSRRILNKLREGRTLKQIASELDVSLRTVNTDLNKLYEVVGVDTLFSLGVWWGSEAAAEERKLG